MKKIWKELGIFYFVYIFICMLYFIQINVTTDAIDGISKLMLVALPTNILFWYTLVLLYRIMVKNKDIIKYVPNFLGIIFYIDLLPKYAGTIFSVCYFNEMFLLSKDVANFILLGIIFIDFILEIGIVFLFHRFEKSDYRKNKDHSIKLESIIYNKNQYEKGNSTILISVVIVFLPIGYWILVDKNVMYVISYMIFAILINAFVYRLLRTRCLSLFDKEKNILRCFILEVIVHIVCACVCVWCEYEPINRIILIIVAIALGIYWSEKITYQMAKSLARMDLYLKQSEKGVQIHE